MKTDSSYRDCHGDQASKREYPPGKFGSVLIFTQPLTREVVCKGDGDHQRNTHQHHKLFCKQPPKVNDRGAKYFPHAYFFDPLLSHERCETKYAETGNEYG